jgi:hypothetical protein
VTRIFDTFMFHNEVDLLQCRLEELSPVVDRFVIVECGENHQGAAKASCYLANEERFASWKDQIEYVWVPGLKETNLKLREHEHRNWIRFGLTECDAEPDDIVIQSDVDEMITAAALIDLGAQFEEIPGTILAFDQSPRYFAVDWQHPRRCAIAPAARRFEHIGSFWDMRKDSVEAPCVLNAGWHFSWLGDSSAHLAKIEAIYEGPEIASMRPHLIAGNNRRLGIHVDGVQMAPVEIDDNFPAFIRERRCPHSWFRPRPEKT